MLALLLEVSFEVRLTDFDFQLMIDSGFRLVENVGLPLEDIEILYEVLGVRCIAQTRCVQDVLCRHSLTTLIRIC